MDGSNGRVSFGNGADDGDDAEGEDTTTVGIGPPAPGNNTSLLSSGKHGPPTHTKDVHSIRVKLAEQIEDAIDSVPEKSRGVLKRNKSLNVIRV